MRVKTFYLRSGRLPESRGVTVFRPDGPPSPDHTNVVYCADGGGGAVGSFCGRGDQVQVAFRPSYWLEYIIARCIGQRSIFLGEAGTVRGP